MFSKWHYKFQASRPRKLIQNNNNNFELINCALCLQEEKLPIQIRDFLVRS